MDEYWNLASTVGQTIYINSDLLASRGADWWTISGVFFSTVTAIAGVVIAIKAHKLSRTETKENRIHNRLSVFPLLGFRVFRKTDTSKEFSLTLINQGVGPAIISKVIIKISGETILESGSEKSYIASIGSNVHDYRGVIEENLECGKLSINTVMLGYSSVLAPNKEIESLNVKFLDENISLDDFINATNKIEYYIEYKNIYGDVMPPLKYFPSINSKD